MRYMLLAATLISSVGEPTDADLHHGLGQAFAIDGRIAMGWAFAYTVLRTRCDARVSRRLGGSGRARE